MKKLLLTIALTLVAMQAKAMTGNEFLQECKSDTGQIFCLGYIDGLMKGIFFGFYYGSGGEQQNLYCLPEKVTASQILDMVIKFIEEDVEGRHKPATILVSVALRRAFPCENS